jgi:hypothetical protein
MVPVMGARRLHVTADSDGKCRLSYHGGQIPLGTIDLNETEKDLLRRTDLVVLRVFTVNRSIALFLFVTSGSYHFFVQF